MFLLGALYVGFFVALVAFTNVGIWFLVVIMGGLAFLQYYTSDKIALAASRAKVVERDEAPELHDMIERLCAMADLPKPRIAVVPTDVPNAFATGRNPKNSVVAVTEGLWYRLSKPEVEGVLAHELSHIGNRDVAIMTVSSFFAMVAALLMRIGLFGGMFGGGGSDRGGGTPVWLIMFLVAMLTYVLSYVLILMISRYREYAADRGAALITGAPENLMSALQRIAGQIQQIPQKDLREVQGLNAFFIVPTNLKSLVRRGLHDAPAAREAACPARRDLARDGPAGRPLGPRGAPRRPLRAQASEEGDSGTRSSRCRPRRCRWRSSSVFAPAGVAAVVFKPLSAGEFVRAENEMQELLDVAARESSSRIERRSDDYGYEWLIVRDDAVRGPRHDRPPRCGSELAERGFGAAAARGGDEVRRREASRSTSIYGYKRGAFWPFVPTGEARSATTPRSSS